MQHLIRLFIAVALVLGLSLSVLMPAEARPIERACAQSDRGSADPQTCRCIQRVADQVLTGADQRRAAAFFSDPDRAQDTRMSDRASDEQFWTRYRAFGDSARAICS